MNMNFSSYLVLSSGLVLLTGCSQVNKVFDNKESVNYRTAKTVSSLEVPPDLTAPQYDSTFEVSSGNVSASSINTSDVAVPASGVGVLRGRSVASNVANVDVLPDSTSVQIRGIGSDRRLVVTAPAGVLWPKVQGFWTSVGAKLKRNEPVVGVMETDWIQSRGHLPQGSIQKALGSILKNATDSGIRDRYTLRFEKLTANSTSIYLTHRGAELVVTDTGNKWEMRPRRNAAEAEMLNRLKAYLQSADSGVALGSQATFSSKVASTQSVKQKSVGTNSVATLGAVSGQQTLEMNDSYDNTWVKTGSALTKIGFALDKQDKGKGLYAVKWVGYSKEGKSIANQLKQMFSFKKELLDEGAQQLIHVSRSGNGSTLHVLDKNGRPANVVVSKKILDRLSVELAKVTIKSQQIGRTTNSEVKSERTGRNIDSDGYGLRKILKVGSTANSGYGTEKTGRNIDSDDHGVSKNSSAKRVPASVINAGGQPSLMVNDSYENAWARTGVALKKIGFTLEGQDNKKGLYAVKWVGYSKEGKNLSEQFQQMFSFRREILDEGSQQLIRVSRVSGGAVLQVLDRNGKVEIPEVAKKVLYRLRKELGR